MGNVHCTEKLADEWLNFERLEIVQVFSRADEYDWTPCGGNAARIDEERQ